MRLSVSHRISYHYDVPASRVIQVLRLTPRNHDGQYVASWRIDVSTDCRLDQREDAFGNITHAFAAEGPLRELSLLAAGEIETRDAQGVVRHAVERFPPSFFLRETQLTACGSAIGQFADAARETAGARPLGLLHALLSRLNGEMEYDADATHPAGSAAEAFAAKRGICQDLAHVFIAAARSLAIPPRYVRGYFFRPDRSISPAIGHGWAEAFVPDLGWVAFDVVNGVCATDAHARVAVGLDYLGAAPVRGMRYGGRGEKLAIDIHIDQARRQGQN